jgi:hypothetical protein
MSQVTGRRRPGRMDFGALRLFFFAGQLNHKSCHYQHPCNIFYGDIMPRDCPKCDTDLTRTRRQSWMHNVPGSKYYVCKGCNVAYLLIFTRWLTRWKKYPEKIKSSKGS